MSVITICSLKGGTGKTTTAMHVAAGLARSESTLLVDADPQGTALSWAETIGINNAVAWPVRDIHKRLATQMPSWGVSSAVIDTPPGLNDLGIIRSALRAADLAIVPIAPTAIDFSQVGHTLDLLADECDLEAWVLLTQVDRRSRAAETARESLGELGVTAIVPSEIPFLLALANSYGEQLNGNNEYEKLNEEIHAWQRQKNNQQKSLIN